MQNIHWLGSGLSSIPGIRRLASNNYNLTVWNRTLSKAQKTLIFLSLNYIFKIKQGELKSHAFSQVIASAIKAI